MDDKTLNHVLQQFKELLQDLYESDYTRRHSAILSEMHLIAGKLKAMNSMSLLPPRTLIQTCKKLVKFIFNESSTQSGSEEQVNESSKATLTILLILTSSAIDQSIYSEDIIDKIITYIQQQLHFCCKESNEVTKRQARKHSSTQIVNMQSTISLLTELVAIHTLADVQMNRISSIALYAFENDSKSLSINSIKLLSMIFSKYEGYQLSLLSDIQKFAVQYAIHKELTPSFPIGTSSKNISIFCALIMSILQSTTILPETFQFNSESLMMLKKHDKIVNLESFVSKRYKNVLLYASIVTKDFLEISLRTHSPRDYQQALTDFIQDLLSVMVEPEWPASLTLLSYIAKHTVNVLQSEVLSPSLRTLCIGWLCQIMVKLKECTQSVEKNIEKLDQIITKAHNMHPKYSCDSKASYEITKDTRYLFLQSIFLKYVIGKVQIDDSVFSLKNFYITMWFIALISQELSPKSFNKERKPLPQDDKENRSPLKKKHGLSMQKKQKKHFSRSEVVTSFVNSLHQFDDTSLLLNSSDVKLIRNFLICKEDLIIHFNVYLGHIINMLKFTQICVRIKTMQCIKLLVDVDMTLAEEPMVQFVMHHYLRDSSIAVREISIDLVGRVMLHSLERCKHYYHLISHHLLDRGVSVRKRVLKILRELITTYPDFPSIHEVYSMIFERIDDSAIKPMVVEIFRDKWFTLTKGSDEMINHVKDLNNVMNIAGVRGFKCLKVLVEELLDKKNSDETVKACEQFVRYLVHYVMQNEVNNAVQDLCACLRILNVIACVKPEFLINYISALEPYLSLHEQEDENIIICVTGILESTMPFLENPSTTFLCQLEEDLAKLLFVHKHSVVESCIPCLAVIIKKVTQNVKLVYECFFKFFGVIKGFAENNVSFPNQYIFVESHIQRCLLITGLFLKHFDFLSTTMQEYFKETIADDVFNTFILLLKQSNAAIQWYTLKALGAMCCQYPRYLLSIDLKTIYCNILSSRSTEENMKNQVLSNLQKYLEIEAQELISKSGKSKRQKENATQQRRFNWESEDECSSIKIVVIQEYLQQISNCCVFEGQQIRSKAASILQIVVQNGLVIPQKVMAPLIALTTDDVHSINTTACNLLEDVDHLHPGILHSCLRVGINLSYELQSLVQKRLFIRGYKDAVPPCALLSPVYSIVQRNKYGRRNFISIILKKYEEMDMDINKLIYFSDNLVYLPYKSEDELLFIIQSINLTAATKGYDFITEFVQQLLPAPTKSQTYKRQVGIDIADCEDVENVQALIDRLPKDMKNLQTCVYSFQKCLLLLKVRQCLQQMYGISNRKITLYSPDQEQGTFEIISPSCVPFMPEPDLKVLQQIKTLNNMSQEQLINQYLELKQLVFSGDDVFKRKALQTINCEQQEYRRVIRSKKLTVREVAKSKKTGKISHDAKRKKKRVFQDSGSDSSIAS